MSHAPGPPEDDPPAGPAEPATRPAETERRARKRAGIQIDGYKIVADVRPVEIGEPDPETWREVREAVHAKLKKIVVDAVGLVGDALEGARKFVRGLAEIPAAAARRIDRAHEQADRREGVLQEKLAAEQLPPPRPSEAAERLMDFFNELRAEGVCVERVDRDDGSQAIVIARPELGPVAARAVQAGLPPPAADGPGTAGVPVAAFLTRRVAALLEAQGIRTAGDLAARSADDLLALEGFGPVSLEQVRRALDRLGLRLRDEPEGSARPRGGG